MSNRGGADIFDHREGREQPDVLESTGDSHAGALVHFLPGEVLTGQMNGAGARWIDSGDEVENSGFARAIWSDQSDQLALIDGEVDGIEDSQSAKANGNVVELEKRNRQSGGSLLS
jgi:hypothetical protein